jgi:hypothetical protein
VARKKHRESIHRIVDAITARGRIVNSSPEIADKRAPGKDSRHVRVESGIACHWCSLHGMIVESDRLVNYIVVPRHSDRRWKHDHLLLAWIVGHVTRYSLGVLGRNLKDQRSLAGKHRDAHTNALNLHNSTETSFASRDHSVRYTKLIRYVIRDCETAFFHDTRSMFPIPSLQNAAAHSIPTIPPKLQEQACRRSKSQLRHEGQPYSSHWIPQYCRCQR